MIALIRSSGEVVQISRSGVRSLHPSQERAFRSRARHRRAIGVVSTRGETLVLGKMDFGEGQEGLVSASVGHPLCRQADIGRPYLGHPMERGLERIEHVLA